MTKRAFLTEAFLVDVVLFVTFDALQGRILVGCSEMALLARDNGVKSDERKFGKVVIEKNFFPPTLLIVASFTEFSFLPFVNVVSLVASLADERQFCFNCRFRVTALALDLSMLFF